MTGLSFIMDPNYFLLYLSITLVIITLFICTKAKLITPKNKFISCILLSTYILYIIIFLVSDFFTGKGIDESIIYHIVFGLNGAGFKEYDILIFKTSLAIILSLLLPYALINKISSNHKNQYHKKNIKLLIAILAIVSFISTPTTKGLYQLGYTKFNHNKNSSNLEFNDFYRKPNMKAFPSPLPNLVFIYAESLEKTYFNDTIFPNLTPELGRLAKHSINFDNIKQVYGTGWTIAGITASQCGIPLVGPSNGNSMGELQSFLPNISCLGDMLSQAGYQLEFFQGTSASFAGNGNFLLTHSYDKVHDKDELVSRLKRVPINGWGLYDYSLFEEALKRHNELSQKAQPFGLFISTMDTHHPTGHQSGLCERFYGDGKNPILNAVKCSDHLISSFIEKILSSPETDNTIIVVASDHLAMNNTASKLLNSTERSNLFMVISPHHLPQSHKKVATTMDIAPTLLHLMGFEADIGLGRNILIEDSLLEQIPNLNEQLKQWHHDLLSFWGFPKINNNTILKINIEKQTVSINNTSINMPFLITIDKDKNSTVIFPDSTKVPTKSLDTYVRELNYKQPFIWIDRCTNISQSINTEKTPYCLMYGTVNLGKPVILPLQKDITISGRDIFNSKPTPNVKYLSENILSNRIDPDRFIAHAGGSINGHTYTNCLEALDFNYEKGFRKFELDIIKTSDNHFVAAHDWSHWKRLTKYTGELPPTRIDFLNSIILGKYTPLDMEGINDWFLAHPDAYLVTDKTNEPLLFASKFVDKSRLIMELFSENALYQAREIGISSHMPNWDIIRDFTDETIQHLVSIGVTDLAVSRRKIQTHREDMVKLKEHGIRVFVYHVNADSEIDERFVICNDMDTIYGLYADTFDFNTAFQCDKTN